MCLSENVDNQEQDCVYSLNSGARNRLVSTPRTTIKVAKAVRFSDAPCKEFLSSGSSHLIPLNFEAVRQIGRELFGVRSIRIDTWHYVEPSQSRRIWPMELSKL